MVRKKSNILRDFYSSILKRTIQARKDLIEVQEALEYDKNFLLVKSKGEVEKARSSSKCGIMMYNYGMLILLRNNDDVVFRADTKGWYQKLLSEGYKLKSAEEEYFLNLYGVKMKGFIDSIFINTKKHLVVDWKTGSYELKNQTQDDIIIKDSIQMLVYGRCYTGNRKIFKRLYGHCSYRHEWWG